MRKAAILYMSGTGNTARAAGIIAAELGSAGWESMSVEIRKGGRAADAAFGAGLLVLCFPTLGFGMPALVRTEARRLRGAGRLAAVFSTWGGDGGAALFQARWFLRRRGFRVRASAGAVYPFQWTQVVRPPRAEAAVQAVAEGDEEARRFARSLTAAPPGTSFPVRAALGMVFLPVAWLYAAIGRFGLGAMYAADNNCKACGRCVRACPAGAMVMAGVGKARRPRWRTACQGCNRCINICPNVQVSPVRAAVHLTVNAALVVGAVAALVWASHAPAAQSVPASIRTAVCIVCGALLLVYSSRLQFAALEPALFALEGLPVLRRLIGRSWTARFSRYVCPGFNPGFRP